MRLAGENNKDKVQQLRNILPVGKQVRVSFSKHSDIAMLQDVRLATQASIKDAGGNVPGKRKGEGGKEYTPAVVALVFEGFTLDVVMDDIDYSLMIGGVKMKFNWGELEIKEV